MSNSPRKVTNVSVSRRLHSHKTLERACQLIASWGFWHWCLCIANVPVRRWTVALILKCYRAGRNVFSCAEWTVFSLTLKKSTASTVAKTFPVEKSAAEKKKVSSAKPGVRICDSFSAPCICPSLQEWYVVILCECMLWIMDDCFLYRDGLHYQGREARNVTWILLVPWLFCSPWNSVRAWYVRMMTTNQGQVYNVDDFSVLSHSYLYAPNARAWP